MQPAARTTAIPSNRRPVRFVTEECVVDTTMLPSEAVTKFCTTIRAETRADADRVVQLMAALARFQVRLVRRTEYAKQQEGSQPGVAKNTARRLDDERAALSVIQAQAVAISARAHSRHQQLRTMKAAEKACAGAQFELSLLDKVTASLVENCNQLMTDARRTIQSYTASIKEL